MILCKACGYDNPMTTVFCRSCGVRIEFDATKLGQSIQQDNAAKRDRDVFQWGRSAISLCVFALAVALVLRYIAVPQPPPADVPATADLPLFAASPTWAKATLPAATTGTLDDLVTPASRLEWRMHQGSGYLSAFSLDLAPLTEAQNALLAAQRPDGSFPGGTNEIAATALAALGLQAWPRDATQLAAAARARAWLDSNWKKLSGTNPTAKALAIGALLDAEGLSDMRRKQLGALLVDGSSPLWQAINLAVMTPTERPTELIALRNALPAEHWAAYFAQFAGQSGGNTGTTSTTANSALSSKPAAAPLKLWFSGYGENLATAEERLPWLFLAWQTPRAPDDLGEVLRTWTGAATIPVGTELTALTGAAIAQPALRLMMAATPIRMPVIPLSR